MSPGAASIARVALLAGAIASLLLLAGLASRNAPAPSGIAEAADCLLAQHSKKHIHRRKVTRKGKKVTIKKKHVHRWTTCDPVPDPPLPTCTVPSANLQVISRDLTGSSYTLSRPCVTTGAVNVELFNQGEDPHNVFLRPVGGSTTPDPDFGIPANPPFELAPMGVEDRTFSLTRGEWYLWCSLTTHEEQGMHANLTVR